jgi:hypothetical protein
VPTDAKGGVKMKRLTWTQAKTLRAAIADADTKRTKLGRLLITLISHPDVTDAHIADAVALTKRTVADLDHIEKSANAVLHKHF